MAPANRNCLQTERRPKNLERIRRRVSRVEHRLPGEMTYATLACYGVTSDRVPVCDGLVR